MTVHRYRLYAHNFQFVLMDAGCPDDAAPVWDDDALERMLAVLPTSAWIGTLRDDAVHVRLAALDAAPDLDLGRVDHASEGSFELPSGVLVVMGSSDASAAAARVTLTAGRYRLLATLTGADAGPGNDTYTLYLWPGDVSPPRLLKHW